MSLPLDVAFAQCERHASIRMTAFNERSAQLTEAQMDSPVADLLRLLNPFVMRFTNVHVQQGHPKVCNMRALRRAGFNPPWPTEVGPTTRHFCRLWALFHVKLQDAKGHHVLRQFATDVLREPAGDAAFLKILKLLEWHGYMTAQAWALQRSVRHALAHALAHEYAEYMLRLVLVLNNARAKAIERFDWLFKMKSKAFSL